MSWQNEYFGDELKTKSGDKKTSDLFQGKKYIGIYFSAHWCPPCRRFTPLLAEFYDSLKGEDEGCLEIVFVSGDEDEAAFDEYFADMPWSAVPFSARDLEQSLSARFDVQGIPHLVILDGTTGSVVDEDGRGTISSAKGDSGKVLAAWKK